MRLIFIILMILNVIAYGAIQRALDAARPAPVQVSVKYRTA